MKRTIKLKLNISKEDKVKLKKTIVLYNQVRNEWSEWAMIFETHNRFEIQSLVYHNVRDKFPELPSALVLGARDVACESLKSVKFKTTPKAKPYSAIRYNKSVISYFFKYSKITLGSINKRVKVTFQFSQYFKKYSDWEVKSSNLVYIKKTNEFYLFICFESPTPVTSGDRVLGIDRGIVNIAVCSNNKFFNSKHIKQVRGKYAYLRKTLQSKGTKSAKRLLKKISGKEKRFGVDTNHCISKEIVNLPFDIFVLEDLKGIRLNSKGKDFNRKLNSWSFFQLKDFINYKAENIGKRVIYINPKYTSQKCSKCGTIVKSNRVGNSYHCACGCNLHADLNASRNIAQLGISFLSRVLDNNPNVAT